MSALEPNTGCKEIGAAVGVPSSAPDGGGGGLSTPGPPDGLVGDDGSDGGDESSPGPLGGLAGDDESDGGKGKSPRVMDGLNVDESSVGDGRGLLPPVLPDGLGGGNTGDGVGLDVEVG